MWSDECEDEWIARNALSASLGDCFSEAPTQVLDDEVREIPVLAGGFSHGGREERLASVNEAPLPVYEKEAIDCEQLPSFLHTPRVSFEGKRSRIGSSGSQE